ncbi:MAG: hydroxylamine oxidase [Deltaproteobacteria bacterium]|nr:hydroxylamine oxidase [Deltaproteobacteria bacterium]
MMCDLGCFKWIFARMGFALLGGLLFLGGGMAMAASPAVSDDSETCLGCHVGATPGIVSGWKKGRMARMTPETAMKNPPVSRRISIDKPPEKLAAVVVGCAECHTMNAEKHKDSFEHNGYSVHVVVTPGDCAVCHPTEVDQYGLNIMSHAYSNLQGNPLFRSLGDATNGLQTFENMKITQAKPDPQMEGDACLFCHGTKVEVKGMTVRDTPDGEMDFPLLSGWPNRGVGRINPDGTRGSCAACHTRHGFSIEMARKPYTCSECHKGPDVPAYKVYNVSKHGNIFSALGGAWQFDSVPWTLGKDFTAPTCAVCHISMVVTDDGEILSERTHSMSNRLPLRLFGLIYAHPSPKSPDTTVIRNSQGLPLPTELTGEPATKYLIDEKEQAKRLQTMEKVCLACHAQGWVDGHFARLNKTVQYTNDMSLTATNMILAAWKKGYAKGLAQQDNPFDEAIEKMWVQQWLFYANTTRLASAMVGADYGVFADGRWFLSKNNEDMLDWLKSRGVRN